MANTKSGNPVVNLASEHLQMRQMIEALQHQSITINAWNRKYKNFMCDPQVEMYVNDMLAADERFSPSPQRRQH